ncbi:response regulator [Bradyrhizobium sp. GCM10028915]|uniref:response regulator n=1 Tax=Bradyrhizobium sp. GCM10028915 TaxID=3273385 RepID=UPI00361E9E4D
MGKPQNWSAHLKTTVSLLLGAEAQIVLFWGPEFVALYNDAYAPTIGDKHPGALGRPAKESWSELWDDLEPLLRGVRETGRTFSAKDRPFYIERHGFGETVYFDVSYSAVPDAEGRVGGVLCIVSETTERVRAEAALRESEARLRQLNETLEHRILQRTRELECAHVALRQAQKMEAVGRLTGGIAHDFNNLLQGITGSLDLIRRKPDDAGRVSRWAEAGLKSADRGARLAGQLLAFSRTQKMDISSIDVSSALTGFADMLRRTIGPSIDLRMDLDTDGVFAEGDRTQLELAVLNLALNARDAMPGGGELVVAARPCRLTGDPELQDGDYVELSVKDSGTGMTADVAEHAFEPFFTTKDVGKGTGLGLSQVYGTLHQSGGAVRIESAPGTGTTVRLYLRRTEVQPRRTKEHSAEAERAPAATVLIVDDDPDVRAFLTDSLETLGYSSLVAEDGVSALKALQRAAPAAMILDFAMPGMNGAEVAKRARQSRPDLPIIFASGYSETAALSPVQESKHSRMLHKPFKVGELQSALAELLAGPD